MRHARPEALDRLSTLLGELRDRPVLREKSRGVFYLRSRAFLHFHEDPSGLFADVRLGDDFVRMPVTSTSQQATLLKRVDRHLAGLASQGDLSRAADR